jgi:hypothetical protein
MTKGQASQANFFFVLQGAFSILFVHNLGVTAGIKPAA